MKYLFCVILLAAGCQTVPSARELQPEFLAQDAALFQIYNSGNLEELQQLLFADKWLLSQCKIGIIRLSVSDMKQLHRRIALLESMIRNLRMLE